MLLLLAALAASGLEVDISGPGGAAFLLRVEGQRRYGRLTPGASSVTREEPFFLGDRRRVDFILEFTAPEGGGVLCSPVSVRPRGEDGCRPSFELARSGDAWVCRTACAQTGAGAGSSVK